LGERQLSEVREITTIDLKENEPGLVKFCQQHGLPLRILASETVVARCWVTKAWDWVQQNVALPGVCETCVLIVGTSGKLIVPIMALDGVAVPNVVFTFGRDVVRNTSAENPCSVDITQMADQLIEVIWLKKRYKHNIQSSFITR
jgi:hypothetical protein